MEELLPSDQLLVNPGLAMREAAAIGVVCRDAASGSKASLIAPIFSVSPEHPEFGDFYNCNWEIVAVGYEIFFIALLYIEPLLFMKYPRLKLMTCL